MAWIYATQASVAASGTIITINSGESMAAVMPADAAILGANQAVEVKSAQQVGGVWQLVLERPWPYAAVTNGTLTVQPNGSRFQAAIQALRDVNTYAANTHAAMNDWLTSTAASITVETADGSEVNIPTLYSYTQNWGAAATRDVGTAAGNVMEVGAGGLIIGPEFVGNVNLADLTSGCRAFLSASQSPSAQVAVGLALTFGARTTGASINNRALQIFCDTSLGKLSYRCVGVNGMTNEWSFKTSLNTVIDTNGFIKAASPVLRLLNDRIEANPEAELQSAQFERVGQGHYTITNTQGLADSGWRIEVPRDEITGELLRFVQCTQARAQDGTWTITVKTYAPNYSAGALSAGDPLDLDERWIDVRLNSLPEQAADEGDAQPIE